ncbi:MAG TPA: PepSY domain-containing protein [Vicinamibacteria bacterium]|nr:PepSY domain-containing protein [Vicinamibacteria bacterium]
MRARNAGIIAIALVAGLSAAGSAMAAENAALLKEAKISEAKAREIALKQAPGTVKSSELEKEKGTLVWSFDITNAKGAGITEVLVSAIDGHVVETKAETAKDEAAEKAKEAKEAKKTTKHKASKHTTQ